MAVRSTHLILHLERSFLHKLSDHLRLRAFISVIYIRDESSFYLLK